MDKTFSELIAERRRYLEGETSAWTSESVEKAKAFLDDIEAAHNRAKDDIIHETPNEDGKESFADIIGEMRIFKCRNLSTDKLDDCTVIQQYLARRLVAAYDRDIAELVGCLKEAVGDKTGAYTMKGTEVSKWTSVLEKHKEIA